MLKSRLIPKPLQALSDRPKIAIVESPQAARFPTLDVAMRLLWWCLTILWMRANRQGDSAEYGRRLRLLLEQLGGLWIKVGQLLSLRIDIFSFEFCRELAHLQVNAVGFSPAEAMRIIEEDLGGPLHEFFREFEKQPFAAASMGQVHIARLRDSGVRVAVKVQRPSLPAMFAHQIRLIRWIVALLQLVRFRPHMGWEDMIWELNQIMREEMDCQYEGSVTRRMRRTLKAHDIYVPKVFYATQRVLVTEFIDGVLMADYIATLGSDPELLKAWRSENKIDPKVVARRLSFSLMRQIIEDNLYHGDLHPGNIMLLRDNRVALIDFGGCSFTERGHLEKLRISMRALSTREYAKWADTSLLVCGALPPLDLDVIREDFIRAARDWSKRTAIHTVPYHQKSVAALYNALVQILYNHHCTMGWPILRVRRAMETLDSSLVHLDPDSDYFEISTEYFREAYIRGLDRGDTVDNPSILASARSTFEIVERLDEFAFFHNAIVRRQVRIFQAATNKTVDVLSSATAVTIVILLIGLLALTIFVADRQPARLGPAEREGILWLFRMVPHMDWQIWALVLAVCLYTVGILGRLRNRLYRRTSPANERVALV